MKARIAKKVLRRYMSNQIVERYKDQTLFRAHQINHKKWYRMFQSRPYLKPTMGNRWGRWDWRRPQNPKDNELVF